MASMQRVRPAGLRAPLRARVAPRVVCQATQDSNKIKEVAVAAVVATSLLAITPEAALAARSGGRVSSSGFAARRAAPSAMGPRRSATVNNYHHTTVVAAPPVVSPFGFGSPFGGYGFFGLRPVVFMPFPFLGGLLQFFLLTLLAGFVFSLVKGAANGGKKQKRSDDWDSL